MRSPALTIARLTRSRIWSAPSRVCEGKIGCGAGCPMVIRVDSERRATEAGDEMNSCDAAAVGGDVLIVFTGECGP